MKFATCSDGGIFQRTFMAGAAVLFLIVGVGKLAAAQSVEPVMQTTEPLIGLRYPVLFVIEGILQCGLSLFLIFEKSATSRLLAVLLFSGVGLAYHGTRYSLGIAAPCHCLGPVISWWPWLDLHRTQVAVTILVSMSCISLILLGKGAVISRRVGSEV